MADKTTTLKTKTNDNVYPNVIGDNRDNAISDSAHINHTLTKDHKINFRLDTNVSGLIFNSLQKPSGLTKTKLVGVGANGQENIEIGDNLTLANGKLSATGGSSGGGIPVVEGTVTGQTAESITITIPEAQTEPFILHIENIQSYILMSVIMGAYLGYLYKGRNEKVAYIFQGADTTIDVSTTNPIVPIVNATNTNDSDRYTISSNQEFAFILHIEDSAGISNIFMSASNDGTLYYYYGIEDIISDTITYLYGSGSTVQRYRIKISGGGETKIFQGRIWYHFITMTNSNDNIALYLTIQNLDETAFTADMLYSYFTGNSKKVLANGNLHGVVPTYIAGEGGVIKIYYRTPGDSNINPTPDEYHDLSSFTITDLVSPVE